MHKIIISIPINNGCSTDDALSLLWTSFLWTVITTQHTQLHTCSYMYIHVGQQQAYIVTSFMKDLFIYAFVCLFV